MKALVVGGTGPTGPHVVEGLVARGYDVTLFHRGLHEVNGQADLEHIHGDARSRDSLASLLSDRRFDLVAAMYGRTRLVAEVMAGRCDRLVAIGGIAVYRGYLEPSVARPHGMRVGANERSELVDEARYKDTDAGRRGYLPYQTERTLFDLEERGAFAATVIRYPHIYGPREKKPQVWSVIRRVLDGRRVMILPDGGLSILARCAARNAAHCVLLAVDRPRAASGHAFNCLDDDQLTLRQWMETVAEAAGGSIGLVSVPDALAWPSRPLFPLGRTSEHGLTDGTLAKVELGYADVVSAHEALRDTVAWYLDHPPAPDEVDDVFDYAGEDRLIRAYDRLLSEVTSEAAAIERHRS